MGKCNFTDFKAMAERFSKQDFADSQPIRSPRCLSTRHLQSSILDVYGSRFVHGFLTCIAGDRIVPEDRTRASFPLW